jgi:thioredoxin reductase (NADPH)
VSDAFDIVVAGSGIAGLTAALTSARLGRRTLVLTGDVLGGQLLSINKIDGYPGFANGIAGYDLCPITQEQAVAAGAEFAATELTALEAKDGFWHLTTADGIDYAAHGVILATGAALKELGVPGEERLRGKGVSHCASCDAPLLKNRIVAVIGGGDSAAQEALTLAEAAVKVVILHRGTALSAQASYRNAVTQHPKIEIRYGTEVKEILGGSGVTGVKLGDGTTLETAAVFSYIGLWPSVNFLDGKLALDPTGRIPTDLRTRTSLPGICAAGAVRAGWPGRAIASAGEGAASAIAIDRFLAENRWCDSE